MFSRTLRRGLLALAGAGALTASAVLPGQAATTPGWRITKVYPASSSLSDVVALSATDAFAIGSQANSDGSVSATPVIAAEWNGTTWKSLPQPPATSGYQPYSFASAGAASSPGNAWIFEGTTKDGGAADYTAAQRWTGTAWAGDVVFPAWVGISQAVTSGPSDAWAFGQVVSPFSSYVAHYNGKHWSRVSFPIVAASVSALSGADIWAVGEPAGKRSSASAFSLEHYSKGAWHAVATPVYAIPKGDGFQVSNVVAESDTNVWVAAGLSRGEGVTPGVVLAHYNGRTWTHVTVPYPATAPLAMASDGAGGIWLEGTEYTKTSFAQYFYHDSNGHWTRTVVPHSHGIQVGAAALAWIPGSRSVSVWAAGQEWAPASSSGSTNGIILKYGA